MRAKGNLIADYGADGQSASFQYPGWDPTNPANYAMDSFYYRGFNNESELREGVFNARYMLTDELTLRAGVAYHKFTQGGRDVFYDDNVNGTRSKTQGTSVADITSVFTNKFGSWLIGDYDKAFAKYKDTTGSGPTPTGPAARSRTSRTSTRPPKRPFPSTCSWTGTTISSASASAAISACAATAPTPTAPAGSRATATPIWARPT